MERREHTDWYRENFETYQAAALLFEGLIGRLCALRNLHPNTESRVKKLSSFLEKIGREGKSYTNPCEEVTDLAGVRVILPSLIEVDAAEALIRDEFDVDDTRSSDKRTTYDPDHFGYLSTHLIVRLGPSRRDLPEWSEVRDVWVEIQIRTALEHAWAAASHEIDYKTPTAVPSELKKRLYQLIAILSNVDIQLKELLTQARELRKRYKDEIEKNELDIELNGDSLSQYVMTSKPVDEFNEYVRSLGVNVTASEIDDRAIRMAKMFGVDTIRKLDSLLKQSMPWLESVMHDYLESMFSLTEPKRIWTNEAAMIITALIATFADKLTPAALNMEWGWGGVQILEISKKYNPNFAQSPPAS